jgi:hypothetical protein
LAAVAASPLPRLSTVTTRPWRSGEASLAVSGASPPSVSSTRNRPRAVLPPRYALLCGLLFLNDFAIALAHIG